MLGPSGSALINLGARFPSVSMLPTIWVLPDHSFSPCMKNVTAIPPSTELACMCCLSMYLVYSANNFCSRLKWYCKSFDDKLSLRTDLWLQRYGLVIEASFSLSYAGNQGFDNGVPNQWFRWACPPVSYRSPYSLSTRFITPVFIREAMQGISIDKH